MTTTHRPPGADGPAYDRVVTVPNALSALRLALVPVFLVLVLRGHDGWALVVLGVSGVSDYLDGAIARRFGLVSRLGQALDPIADRLHILATLSGLWALGILPWWFAVALLARDVFTAVLVQLVRRHGYRGLPVHLPGKVATFCLLLGFPLLLLAQAQTSWAVVAQPVGWALAWWGLGLYWVAAGLYFAQCRHLLAAGASGAAP